MKKLSLVLFFLNSILCIAQTTNPSSELRLSKNAEVMREMDRGVDLMEAGNHFEADSKFRYALRNMKVIPANLAYYIGKNSFYLNEYKQSIDWLTKYIEIKGTSGQYYEEAVEILKKSEEIYSSPADSSSRVPNKADSLDLTPKINCTGKVICPVCNGKTVIIKRGQLKTTYTTCPYSDKNGYLTCEEYKKLMRGELKPKTKE